MEAEENGERRGDVREDGPAKRTVEVQLDRGGFASASFQGVDAPHAEIADQQKGHHLSARLAAYLVGGEVRKDFHHFEHKDSGTSQKARYPTWSVVRAVRLVASRMKTVCSVACIRQTMAPIFTEFLV